MEADIQCTFQRCEKKYMLTWTQYNAFLRAAQAYLTPDRYGCSAISNVYYDTEAFDLIRASLEKPVYKEKLRLRSYGAASGGDTVFVELKKKYKGVVYKRRAVMEARDAEDYLNYGIPAVSPDQTTRELDFFLNRYSPEPKLFLAYDRQAFAGKEDPGLRVTFDQNIRRRWDGLNLGLGDAGTRPLALPAGDILMEVKTAGALPLWLARTLSDLAVFQSSFSKYGACYEQDILAGQMKGKVMRCA